MGDLDEDLDADAEARGEGDVDVGADVVADGDADGEAAEEPGSPTSRLSSPDLEMAQQMDADDPADVLLEPVAVPSSTGKGRASESQVASMTPKRAFRPE